jgi:opacity protein-like surface antigen
MKRIMTVLALAAFAAAPAAAQWAGMPVWNSPKGGTGVTINGDVALPNTDAGKGTAFGARGTLGLANLSITAGVATWKPDGFNESTTSLGAVAGFRVIGGSLLPIALNLQLGAGTAGAITSGTGTVPKMTNIIAGAGLSVNVPTPGINIEPYLSISNRWHKPTGFST